MFSHYLVQDESGRYYIRQGLFGCFPFYGELMDNSNPYKHGYWSFNTRQYAAHPTEESALQIWELFKKGKPKNTFKTLRKLT